MSLTFESARLEALVVDSLLRGESDEEVRSRAAALGWAEQSGVTVTVGRTPSGDTEAVVDSVRRTARQARHDVLTGVQGDDVLDDGDHVVDRQRLLIERLGIIGRSFYSKIVGLCSTPCEYYF